MQIEWASPGSSLWEAANIGNLQLLKRELEKPNVDIDICDDMMRTPLIEAAKYGHPECVRELLLAGSNPDHAAFLGKATDYASDPFIKQMLREASAAKARGVKWSGEADATCRLWEASKTGDLGLLRSVLADPDVDLEVQDGYGKTPLLAAAELDIPGSVRELLLAGANPDHETMLGKAIDYTKNTVVEKMLRDASNAKARGAKWDGGVKSKGSEGCESKQSSSVQQGEASNASGISQRAVKSKEFRIQPCRYFLRGGCRYGDACRFVHDKAAVSDAAAGANPNPSRGKALCRNWLAGGCTYGDNCRFLHPEKNFPTSVGSGTNVKTTSASSDSHYNYDEEESDEEEELEQRMRNCGFTDDEAFELLCQGVKPWDPEAWDVLAALSNPY